MASRRIATVAVIMLLAAASAHAAVCALGFYPLPNITGSDCDLLQQLYANDWRYQGVEAVTHALRSLALVKGHVMSINACHCVCNTSAWM